MDERARVFISCGQRERSDEVDLATAIAKRLNSAGFEPYVATAEQSLRALRENLFPRLTDAEYFLFIDFRRERLGSGQYRGSLFSHQELAIASYLDKDFLGFQEDGVQREGLIDHLQSNCTLFSNRADLPDLVLSEVKRHGWDPHSQNRLHLDLYDPPYADAPSDSKGTPGRFFHLRVTNRHWHRTARNCLAYIRSLVDNSTGKPVAFESVELKWAGYTFPAATIAPRASRRLDAFWIQHTDPRSLRFRIFTDWAGAVPYHEEATDLTITYEVVSESIPGHIAALRVRLSDTLANVVVSHA